MIKVSIITACYNAEKSIEETLRSVQTQTYKDIEHIIVDGASDDGTLSIIDKYNNSVSQVISEPDSGVYNAMNKGIKASNGDLIFFLNADDVFINEKVVEQFANFASTTTSGLILGDILLLDKYSGVNFYEKQSFIDNIQLYKDTVFHPATFFRKEVFEKYGFYNEENKIVSDYEWYLKYFIENKGDFTYLDKPVSIFDMSGLSSCEEHKQRHNQERYNTQQKYFSSKELKNLKLLNKLFPRKINKISFRKNLAKLGLNKAY